MWREEIVATIPVLFEKRCNILVIVESSLFDKDEKIYLFFLSDLCCVSDHDVQQRQKHDEAI
jgi:hypothetical protein